MSEYEDIGSPDSPLPTDMPKSLVRQFSRESQVDFEIDFYRSILERDPHFVEGLRYWPRIFRPKDFTTKVSKSISDSSGYARETKWRCTIWPAAIRWSAWWNHRSTPSVERLSRGTTNSNTCSMIPISK